MDIKDSSFNSLQTFQLVHVKINLLRLQINLLLLRTSFKSAATNTVTGINSNSEKNQLGKKLHKLVIRKIKKHKV